LTGQPPCVVCYVCIISTIFFALISVRDRSLRKRLKEKKLQKKQ
jgi:hypothetical protein